jgi:hypothetical protein
MPIDRHINFFELLKACAKPGCPLCRIIADRAERYIDNMLFEHVSDRGFRAKFRAAGGFCAAHSKNLESFRDGLAIAILGRDILEDRIRFLKNRTPWKPRGRCPVCEERERIEDEYLGFLAGAEEDAEGHNAEELREIFTASDGLCIPHYAKLTESLRSGGGLRNRLIHRGNPRHLPPWLIEFHEHRFEELLRRTGRFIELSAYGRQEEFAALPEQDKLVWKELAVKLRGGADGN